MSFIKNKNKKTTICKTQTGPGGFLKGESSWKDIRWGEEWVDPGGAGVNMIKIDCMHVQNTQPVKRKTVF